ncbi:hypothetical protein M758_3G083300 [Ceratodon purpureus]|nr:hypothetical protein M758_3G083300 [Ceratodon purpureus]
MQRRVPTASPGPQLNAATQSIALQPRRESHALGVPATEQERRRGRRTASERAREGDSESEREQERESKRESHHVQGGGRSRTRGSLAHAEDSFREKRGRWMHVKLFLTRVAGVGSHLWDGGGALIGELGGGVSSLRMEGLQRRVAMGEGAADGGQCDVGGAGVLGLEVNVAKPDGAPDGSEAMVEDANSLRMQVDGGQCDVEGVGVLGLEVNVAKPDGSDAMVEDANSFRMQVDGGQCDGVLGLEVNVAKPDGAPDGSDAMVEDATSLRMQVDGNEGAGSDAGASSCDTIGALGDACSMGRTERIRADIGTGDDDQIESSLISGFEAQNPGVGSSSQPDSEADIEEGYGHLFTDIMKIQLRAQILVLGDLLKGIAPSPEWLEEACLEPGIGVEYALPEPLDAPRDVPPESNLQNLEVTMSPSAESTDPPTVTTAGRLSNPEDPSTSGKDFLYIDDLAQERDVAPSGQLMITYDDTTTARSNPNTAENISQATDTLVHENDKHLDLAQASAQDALTTATSALAQSHMVWARLHSQNHSEEGIARDARIASVAATVAAAASVAKAAVEAARAIAEVSVDAFIQAGGYQAGDTSLAQLGSTRSKPLQVAGLNQSLHGNTRENTSQHRTDMVESVVQAAGKAAEAATQAGVVLSKANPLIQMSGLSEFWSRKRNEGSEEHERNEFGGIDEGNGMDVTNEVGGFGGRRKGDASNEINAVNEVGELDGGNEEDAAEEMEDTQEEDTVSQDILNLDDIMGDVHGGDIANQDFAVEGDMVAPNGDQDGTAAANEAEVFVENGVGMVEANEDEDVGANEVELVPVNEVAEAIEQEKYIGPRSRKSKRGRGRGRGRSQEAPSRAKRLKNSVGASSAIPVAQALENEMHQGEPESPKNDGDANARSEERGVLMKNSTMSTSGKDISDSAPLEPYGEDTPASAAAQIPEDEIQRKDDAPESPKTVRGGNARGRKRGAKGMVRTPVTTSRKGVPPAVPVQASWEERPSPAAAHSKENDMEEQGGVPESLKTVRGGYTRGKKRGGRQVGRTLLRISRKVQSPTVSAPSGEDQPASAAARTPGKEMLREDDGREIAKTVRGGYTRGKKRGGRQVGRTLLRISRKVQSPTVSAPSGEDQPAAVAAHIKENEKQEEDDVRESPKTVRGGYTRGKKRGGRQVGRSPLSTTRKDLSSTVSAPSGEDRPASAAARSPGEEMLREDEVRESPKTGRGGYMRGKKRGGRQVGRSPLSTTREGVPPAVSAQASWEAIPSPASAHTKENEMQEEDHVRESPKTGRGGYMRGKKRGGRQVGRSPLSTTREGVPPAVSAQASWEAIPSPASAHTKENEIQEEDDVRESPKTGRGGYTRGKKRGGRQVGRSPLSTTREGVPPTVSAQASWEERPSPASAHTKENEMQEEDDVRESPKTGRGGYTRGKKRGGRQVGRSPLSTTREGVPPAVSAQASWEERPSPASAHTKENEMQEEDDVRESPKTGRGGYTRGKKRGGMQVGRTPLRISRKVQPPTVSAPLGEDQPASAAALTKVNKMQEEDDIRESPKNVTCENVSGKKRGVKKMVKTLVSTSRKDAPPLSAADDCSPENGMQREGDVSENPKVRGGSARGKKRGAKEIEKTPVSASGKGTAERDLREPESDRNIRDVPEHAVEGSAVEVMTDEVGLRGGWFSGTVLKMNPNEAFVELHDLLTDDGKSNVREWFPLVEGFNPDRPRRHIRPIHPFSIFTEAGSRKRRRVALGSQTWHIGDHVDAFFQDAWWEGIVAELNDLYPSKATIYFPEENDTQVVKTWDLRPSFQWKDNKWTPWKNPVLLEDERPQKRHRTVGPIKSSTKGGPEDLIAQKSNGKSSTQRTERVEIPEDSRTIPEPISSRKKTPIKMLQESKISFKRSSRSKMSFKRLKTSENEDASQKQEGLSTMTRRRAQLKDVLSPGTSKKLDFTTDSIASTASASKVDASRNKASITKAKPRHWRKKVLSDVALLQD